MALSYKRLQRATSGECLNNIPAHTALPGTCATGGRRRGLVGPAIIRTF